MSREFVGIFAPSFVGERERALAEPFAGKRLGGVIESEDLTVGWVPHAQPPGRLGKSFCLLDGTLENGAALANELEMSSVEPAERVLAAAYRQWRDAMLGSVQGRFALVVWDAETREGLLAVDPLGSKSLFAWEEGGRLFFASEVRELLRLLPRRPPPDGRAVAHWIADGLLERGQTLYQGVRRLEGGESVKLADGRALRGCYWLPTYAEPLRLAQGEAARDLRAAIAAAVERRTARAVLSGVLLSGGLDSASVAAVASSGPGAHGVLRAYSVLFPDHPSMDESRLIDVVASRLGLAGTRVLFHRGSMLGASLEYLGTWAVPSVSPNLVFHRPLLRAAADDGVDVLLDGQGGDELFGCAPYLLGDRLRNAQVRSLVALARQFPGVGAHPSWRPLARLLREFALKGAAPHVLHVAARRVLGPEHYAPSWLTSESARLRAEGRDSWRWKRVAGPLWWAHLADELTGGRERMGAHDFLRHKAAFAGLRGGHPYLDDLPLIELVLRFPPDLAFDPELDRPLLRRGMHGLVPDEVRLRREKSLFNALFVESLDGVDRPALTRLVAARDAEINAYVRTDVVRARLLEAPSEWRGAAWAWALWRLATIECWLRTQEDSTFPHRVLETWGLEPPRYESVPVPA